MLYATKAILVLTLKLMAMGVKADSTGEHECRWKYNQLHWDLTPLIRHSPQRDYRVKRDRWEFYLNVCANTIKVKGPAYSPPAQVEQVPSTCKQQFGPTAERSPGYQTLQHDGETACYYMGNVHTAKWGLLDENNPEDGVKLTYSAGTKCDAKTGRSIEYHFICDPQIGVGQPVTVAGECRFMVIWQTIYACPFYPTHYPRLLLWSSVAIVLYLLMGFAYNIRNNGMKVSLAAIPHSSSFLALWAWLKYLVMSLFGFLFGNRERDIGSSEETTRLNPTPV
ncbi:hypothetical protein GUITHDRAFT_147604 [Guillardia theta CCMP2712]|uniref:MRH domain-containing protein n=1 Tax=Guillardia theta (strain CCMP2712) TaxID=905079 RepID=L1ICS7_GUITC|nr:hypothetical protein GUITHDRAFT_147604 [Guillardia theta CCMP2712]EKX33877.1 hypothetical protein GUITHDRAFT_147604 [Guillardia theta CCMP2712]|eukprot:XP_005820857.1 hypothetical protein GUITHDRAFT_147604 [Guillardia theta CCMP2712]